MLTEANGAKIWYQITGAGERKVLLLHGWGCSTELMKPVESALTDSCQVLNIDFPGFGQSGRPPEPWGVPDYAACIRSLLKQLDFIPCDVIAHSFGCRVATWLAAEDSSVFRKMVLTGAAGIRRQQTEEEKKRSGEYQKLKKKYERLSNLPGMKKIAEKWTENLRKKYGSADYNALDEDMRKTFVKVISQDLTDCYAKIRQPVLLLWGDHDTETPLWMGEKMETLIQDCGLVRLENGTHFAYLEQITRFNTIVRHFLMEG